MRSGWRQHPSRLRVSFLRSFFRRRGQGGRIENDLEKSDHFEGRRFLNPTGTAGQPLTAVPRMLAEPRTPWPARIDVPPHRPPPLDGADSVVTFIGHATFLIQTAAGNILTDPMYSQRAGPLEFWGRAVCGSRPYRFDDLPRIDTVLLSHNHYDHCDRRTLLMLAERFDPIVVTPLGNGALVCIGWHSPRRGTRLVAGSQDSVRSRSP